MQKLRGWGVDATINFVAMRPVLARGCHVIRGAILVVEVVKAPWVLPTGVALKDGMPAARLEWQVAGPRRWAWDGPVPPVPQEPRVGGAGGGKGGAWGGAMGGFGKGAPWGKGKPGMPGNKGKGGFGGGGGKGRGGSAVRGGRARAGEFQTRCSRSSARGLSSLGTCGARRRSGAICCSAAGGRMHARGQSTSRYIGTRSRRARWGTARRRGCTVGSLGRARLRGGLGWGWCRRTLGRTLVARPQGSGRSSVAGFGTAWGSRLACRGEASGAAAGTVRRRRAGWTVG